MLVGELSHAEDGSLAIEDTGEGTSATQKKNASSRSRTARGRRRSLGVRSHTSMATPKKHT